MTAMSAMTGDDGDSLTLCKSSSYDSLPLQGGTNERPTLSFPFAATTFQITYRNGDHRHVLFQRQYSFRATDSAAWTGHRVGQHRDCRSSGTAAGHGSLRRTPL